MSECFFCNYKNKDTHEIILETDNFYVRLDGFPVNPGHCEIVIKKHIESFFELDDKLITELYNLIKNKK